MARNDKDKNNQNDEPFEKKLWKTADKLRKNMDAAEYKHIVLGLIFLKLITIKSKYAPSPACVIRCCRS